MQYLSLHLEGNIKLCTCTAIGLSAFSKEKHLAKWAYISPHFNPILYIAAYLLHVHVLSIKIKFLLHQLFLPVQCSKLIIIFVYNYYVCVCYIAG